MYIRTKRVRGHTYHYLVESHRVNGVPKQKVIAYLGHYKSVDEAIEKLPRAITRLKRERNRMERSLTPSDGGLYNRKLKAQIAGYDETIRARSGQLESLKALQVVPNQG